MKKCECLYQGLEEGRQEVGKAGGRERRRKFF